MTFSRYLYGNVSMTLPLHTNVPCLGKASFFFFLNNIMMIRSLSINDQCYLVLTMCRTRGNALPVCYPVCFHGSPWGRCHHGWHTTLRRHQVNFLGTHWWKQEFRALGCAVLQATLCPWLGCLPEGNLPGALFDLNYASTLQGESGWWRSLGHPPLPKARPSVAFTASGC